MIVFTHDGKETERDFPLHPNMLSSLERGAQPPTTPGLLWGRGDFLRYKGMCREPIASSVFPEADNIMPINVSNSKNNPELRREENNTHLEMLCREIAEHHKITVDALKSKRRDKYITIAKHHFMYEARNRLHYTTARIGRFLGLDHTTVLHGCKRHQERQDREKLGLPV